MRKLLTAALLSSAALFVQTPDKGPVVPEVGKPAPTFRLNDHEGNGVVVGGQTERWTVVAFYPKAMTPG